MNTKKILSILLALVLMASLAAGCKKVDTPEESSGSTSSKSSSSSTSSKAEEKKEQTIADHLPGMVDIVKEMETENSDTVGWLQISQLGIGDVVVMNTESNEYYRRKNFKKEDSFNGVLYADRRSTFGDGSVEQLGMNTCIYGHAMADIRGEKNYEVFFGPLHDFRDPEIAKKIPYLYFTTEKQDLAFEVFAVFITNTYNPAMPYNRNDITEEEFHKMIKEEVLPRSLYNYDVEINPGDKFLTLSTCIYNLPNGATVSYPNTYMRYGIMAKLVDSKEAYKEEAALTINEHPVLDTDGKVF